MRSSNVLVVIGSGGMGIPVARRLGVGKRILLADFSTDNLTIAQTTLTNEGYSTQTALLDVANFASVTELAQQAAKMGSIETIVHTAGVGPSAGSARRVYEINLQGTINVIDAFMPMIQAGSNLVCISSMAGHLCPPLSAEFERHLATASREEVLNHPDLKFDDSSSRGAATARLEGPAGKFVESSPAGRAGAPEDIVNAIAFLVNAASCFITGTDILVDGGVTASVRWKEV
ncbi:short-chain dehydrogenase reductase sdr [Colletotrichum kahawae]|uniref:Short-chain dehydrogenase reductase sdr n=1 Tax=Colletotrichum kahawae TaxID=34407 RepID=A0AAE0D433_COLKA|nr:short-chain dehydrogenase reductase sdr [Colletotrichum kahawae]